MGTIKKCGVQEVVNVVMAFVCFMLFSGAMIAGEYFVLPLVGDASGNVLFLVKVGILIAGVLLGLSLWGFVNGVTKYCCEHKVVS